VHGHLRAGVDKLRCKAEIEKSIVPVDFKASYCTIPVKVQGYEHIDGTHFISVNSDSLDAAKETINNLNVTLGYPEVFNPIV
jgi:hypothetical protein